MDYKIIRKIFFDCFRIDKNEYPKTNVLTVAHDNDRSLMFSGKYYSPLVDTIEDELVKSGVSCISIARVISTIKGDISYGKVYSPDGRFARALVLKRLKGLFFRSAYPYSKLEENAWGDILDKTGAKKLFGIQPSRELCVACHKRGVWVADLQHGVIADAHRWYGKAYRSNDAKEYLPTAFLCWDIGSQRVIDSWASLKNIQTHVIGNRWLVRFLEDQGSDDLVDKLCNKYALEFPFKNIKKIILVTLSWGCSNIKNGFISDDLEKAIKSTSQEYRWLIRLHPNQIKGFASNEGPKFEDYFDKNLLGYAEWIAPTSAPLPVVLRSVDLHISWSSSVCIEAAQLGIKSLMLDPQLRDSGSFEGYYDYYREIGLVKFELDDELKIKAWVKDNINTKKTAQDFKQFNIEYKKIITFLSSNQIYD